MKFNILRAISLFALALPAMSAVVWNETVNGDLSNVGTSPTSLTFAPGSNQVVGSTGRDTANIVDRDYFSFIVPLGYQLTSITILPGTVVGGNVSFLGIQAGPQVTLATNTVTAAGLLGYFLYAPGSGNILPGASVPTNGSSGFSPIGLGAGTYSIWVQDTAAGSFSYGLDFGITAAPEPASFLLVGLGLAGGLATRRFFIR